MSWPPKNIGELHDFDSVVRKRLREQGNISWDSIQPAVSIPRKKGFRTRYLHQIPDGSNSLLSFAKKELKPHLTKFSNAFTPVYEAVKNAYEHGNAHEKDAKILLSTRKDGSGLEVLVGDEGRQGIHPEFWTFVNKVYDHSDTVTNWYDYSKEQRPPEHAGLGTLNIHRGTRDFTYHKSEELGGLLVRMLF